MKLLIKNARLISRLDNLDGVSDVSIEHGKIAEIGVGLAQAGTPVVDGAGLCLAPGLVDLFACATEPEQEDVENALSVSHAAAVGGYTTVCLHTNASSVAQLQSLAERAEYASCELLPAIRATENNVLLNYGDLKLAGAHAVYDDECITHPLRMRDAMFRARKNNITLMSRCRDMRLYGEGLMREGAMSRVMGRPSIPASAEAVVVARDLVLASESGCCVHLAHISTAQSVALIRDAKARGVRVTCSTEPHYCALTSNELANFNTMAKLDPPLGNPEDRQALAEGLRDGTIDCLASGHIPVTKYDKLRSLVSAPPGASGIELALPVALTSLYHTGALSLPRLLECMSAAPAAVLGLNHGRLRVGDEADLVLFDPDAEWVCRARDMVSLSHCTPFDGKTLRGKVCCTIKAGRIVARDGAVM